MIILNILPKKAKKEIRLKAFHLKLKKFFSILLILASVYAMIMLGAKWVMQELHYRTVEKASLLTKSLGENYSQKIKEINSKIDSISKIQKEFIPFTYLIEEVARITGEGISLKSFSIEKEKAMASFSGTAATRNDLLKFKTSLESLNRFEKIDFPISNLAQRENIPFNLNVRIKSYEFSN